MKMIKEYDIPDTGNIQNVGAKMITDKELIEKAKELYKKLGGVGNADARIVRCLWERLEGAKNTEQQVQADSAGKTHSLT